MELKSGAPEECVAFEACQELTGTALKAKPINIVEWFERFKEMSSAREKRRRGGGASASSASGGGTGPRGSRRREDGALRPGGGSEGEEGEEEEEGGGGDASQEAADIAKARFLRASLALQHCGVIKPSARSSEAVKMLI